MTFHLVSEWHLAAPPESAWRVIDAVESWPRWWPEIHSVQLLTPDSMHNEGAVHRVEWGRRLPYRFVLDFVTRASEKPYLKVQEMRGDLAGMGRWEITAIPIGCRVRYVWQVTLHQGWKHWLAPLLSPLFIWKHRATMKECASGMAWRLGVELIDFQ